MKRSSCPASVMTKGAGLRIAQAQQLAAALPQLTTMRWACGPCRRATLQHPSAGRKSARIITRTVTSVSCGCGAGRTACSACSHQTREHSSHVLACDPAPPPRSSFHRRAAAIRAVRPLDAAVRAIVRQPLVRWHVPAAVGCHPARSKPATRAGCLLGQWLRHRVCEPPH